MVYSKADLFEPIDHHFSILCKALSHPARIAILKKIIDYEHMGKATASDAFVGLPLSKSTLFDHLKFLIDKNILVPIREGKSIVYEINAELPDTYFGIIFLIWRTNLSPEGNIEEEISQMYRRIKDRKSK